MHDQYGGAAFAAGGRHYFSTQIVAFVMESDRLEFRQGDLRDVL
jgi:hypothetical protein